MGSSDDTDLSMNHGDIYRGTFNLNKYEVTIRKSANSCANDIRRYCSLQAEFTTLTGFRTAYF